MMPTIECPRCHGEGNLGYEHGDVLRPYACYNCSTTGRIKWTPTPLDVLWSDYAEFVDMINNHAEWLK